MLLLLPLLLLSNSFISTGCAGKLGSNATPAQTADFKRLQVATAIDDATDGILAAHSALWLNDVDTVLVLRAFHVALETVRTSVDPKAAVLSALLDIKRQLPAATLVRWNPYLNSLASVIGAL